MLVGAEDVVEDVVEGEEDADLETDGDATVETDDGDAAADAGAVYPEGEKVGAVYPEGEKVAAFVQSNSVLH